MLLSIFLLTVIISFIGTYAIERIFVNCNIFIDKPSERSSHSSAIPTAGGLAILFSYLVYIVSLSYTQYCFQTIVTPLSTGITCPVVIADSSPAK